jgi:acetolactate decarboxylase
MTVELPVCHDLSGLYYRHDQLRRTDNFFFALRVDGKFDYVLTHAMCKTEEGVPLVKAAAVQPQFEFRNISGTLVGFWTPKYANALNVPGYHFHFLSEDRTCEGHLLECSSSSHQLNLQIQREGNYHIAFPENDDFVNADLGKDRSDSIAKAESYHS